MYISFISLVKHVVLLTMAFENHHNGVHQGSTLELDEATSTDWIRVFADRSLLANVGGPQIEQRRGWLVGWLVGWLG